MGNDGLTLILLAGWILLLAVTMHQYQQSFCHQCKRSECFSFYLFGKRWGAEKPHGNLSVFSKLGESVHSVTSCTILFRHWKFMNNLLLTLFSLFFWIDCVCVRLCLCISINKIADENVQISSFCFTFYLLPPHNNTNTHSCTYVYMRIYVSSE